jgi:hypothetical protein
MTFSSHAQRRAVTSAKSLIYSNNVTSSSPSRLHAAEVAKSQWSPSPSSQLASDASTQRHVSSAGSLKPPATRLAQQLIPNLAQVSHTPSARITHPLVARSFMLQCRRRRLSDSSCQRSDRRRYSSTVATAAVSSDIFSRPSLGNLSSTTSPNISSTSRDKYHLQLVLSDSTAESLSSSYASIQSGPEESQPRQARVIRLSGIIDPIKSLTAALKADRTLRDHQPSLTETSRSIPDRSNVAWEATMNKLRIHTPIQRPSHDAAKVEGNADEVLELYYLLNLNPLYELVVEYPVVQFGVGRMTIQGPRHGVEAALAYIDINVVNLVTTREARSYTRVEAPGRVRLVAAARRVGDVPRPTIWTRRSLAQYVEDVIQTRPPVVLRGSSHSDEAANEEALSITIELLQATEVRSSLSWTVFQTVMSFVMKHRKTNEAWSLLALMGELGFRPYAPFYNPMLVAAAQDQLPDVFEGLLDTMHKQRVRPDAGTWMALLVTNLSVDFKQGVMRNMADRGLSARSGFGQELAPVMIPFSFPQFLGTGGHVADYVDILDDIWGPSWLSEDAVGQLVDVMAARGDIIGAVHLVDHLKDTRSHRPTKTPLYAMLKHCKRTKSVDLAVWLVAYASEHWRVAPYDHITFEWLFKMAWKSRMFNLLRVVWTYVTCAGQATFDMRRDIKQSLDDRLKPEERSVAMRWQSAAGCVACNADPLLGDRSTAVIVASNLARFEKVVPKKPAVAMLIEALVLDKEWDENMSKLTRGTTWKRVNAIKVELTLANRRCGNILPDET